MVDGAQAIAHGAAFAGATEPRSRGAAEKNVAANRLSRHHDDWHPCTGRPAFIMRDFAPAAGATRSGDAMFLRSLLACALLCAAAATAHADIDPGAFSALHWRSIGPYRGGRVLTVAGVPGDARHYYFGAVNGGVWETRDAGRTWQPLFDAQPVGSIGAIALAPSDPNVLYVGSGEADMRSDIAQGDGMYKSTDGGRTWAHIGLGDSQQIGRILVDPHDANLVYVAALGHPYGPNDERGVYRSRDGGKSWQRVLGKDADTGAIDLAFQPGDARVIYASLWQTRRPPWNVYPPSNGPGGGVYKSTDGGDTWQQVRGHGFPDAVGHVGLALSAAAPQRVYALVDGDAGGLYRSDDAGANWTRTSKDERIWQRGWYFGQITVDPADPDRIYAMNTIVLRSDDGGRTFIPLKGDPTGDDFHALWIDPENPQRQILGSDQGTQVTMNGGTTWSSWFNQPTAQIYRVSTDNRFPYWVYGAQQDSGAVALPSRGSSYDGINMTQFHEIAPGGESDNIAPDPADHEVIYGGRVDKLDLRTQQVRHIDPTLAAEPELYRATWTLPLVFSRRDPHVLYFGNQRVFRTRDGGEHWDAISPDLTRENPAVPATLDAATAADNLGTGPRRGVVYAIAPSRVADHDLWVGTDDGLIWRSRDDGAHWDNVTPKALTAWSKVGILDASPFDADSAYAAVDRHRLDDFKPYIYRTHDAGRSWQLIVSGIGERAAVNVVRADPRRQGLLYAGTERGMYVSFDDGGHWQPLQQGLPPTSVRDIDVHGDDVVIATHGRGFYILDDVSPLRQANAEIAAKPAWLYAPAPAVRVRHAEFTGTPMPLDEPRAPNRPDGAYLDYVLGAGVHEPVTIDILDASGAVVRHYSSADVPPAPDLSRIGSAPEWLPPPVLLAATPGMHRFVWPLRYAAAAPLRGDNPAADGVWAPPGNYTVALTVADQRLTQPLEVIADPRVNLPDAAYAQQFALAREIEQQRATLATATHAAGKVLEALAQRREQAPKLAGAIDRVAAGLHDLAGTRAAPNVHNAWSFPPSRVQSLRYVAEALDKLAAAVDGADAAPSPDARAGLANLQPVEAAALAAWSHWQADDLAAINRQLVAAGAETIQIKTD
jgi:photosystem II stability/assembly factor-like uncharacterized protein